MIIGKLIALMGMEKSIQMRLCPIVREKDGLAMSSRNMRLNSEQRAKAPALYKTLVWLKENLNKGSFADLKKEAIHRLEKKGIKADYVEIVDVKTLKPVNEWDSRTNIVGLIAAHVNDVRLIDNMQLA
jgi:pantoate--beta-alanine ligase